jgi:hypothetical protein
MSDNEPRVVVSSDAGGNRGLLVAILVIVIALAAAVWFFNQSGAGEPTDVSIELPAGDVDPGTETTIEG